MDSPTPPQASVEERLERIEAALEKIAASHTPSSTMANAVALQTPATKNPSVLSPITRAVLLLILLVSLALAIISVLMAFEPASATFQITGKSFAIGAAGCSGMFLAIFALLQRSFKFLLNITLVEILIVTVMFGGLAAIVVPQFTTGSSEARAGAMKAQLDTAQRMAELYHARNNAAPDLVQHQWTPLIGEQYLRAAPLNFYTDSSLIVAAGSATKNAGWTYDIATTRLRIIVPSTSAHAFNMEDIETYPEDEPSPPRLQPR